ncbi:hypothetical protein GCM10010358_70900 [Streptomyces minutiscleroticus]|uniref:Uncharacterized protein n=1 Tax=Streptomyces minutiscleroticus TaxID=68238 RepID=A0A918U8H4_9ACTN|nr:hypothetical protein GCM10010358_70900 [Streptomyces minutiscleroticus]
MRTQRLHQRARAAGNYGKRITSDSLPVDKDGAIGKDDARRQKPIVRIAAVPGCQKGTDHPGIRTARLTVGV